MEKTYTEKEIFCNLLPGTDGKTKFDESCNCIKCIDENNKLKMKYIKNLFYQLFHILDNFGKINSS